ncbi:hypothetical protein [Neorhizobium sp. DT-125]|uniref:hypothetical protein n=1 Tax=Neorhizobium sp. DT-125 TaxID=3396163 RepID=UPI003F1E2C71
MTDPSARKQLRLATALLFTCFLPGLASATDPSPAVANPMHEVCHVLATQILSPEMPQIELRHDGCVVKNGKVAAPRYGFWIFDSAQLSGEYAAGGDLYPAIPSRGSIRVEGVRFMFGTMPGTDYLSKVQQAPLALRLLYYWDRGMKRLKIDHAVVFSDQLGMFSLSASLLLGFDPTLAGLAEPQERPAAIEEVSLKLDNKGLFEMYAMGPVVSAVGYDADPEPVIETWKDHHIKMLDLVPPEIAPASTADAMKRFIADVPHPKGVAELSLRFMQPMSVVQLALGGMSIDEILVRARVESSYQP